MPLSEAHIGRRYPPTAPYEVTGAQIAAFARALGDRSAAYAGERPVAPPTFAAVVAGPAWQAMFDDPELGLALHRIVHTDQRITHHQPLRAGDRATAVLTIDKVRSRGTTDLLSCSVSLTTDAGEPLSTVAATFLHARPEAG